MKRRKQAYLLNPHRRKNPMVSFHPRITVWRDPISGKFGDQKKKKSVIMHMRHSERLAMHRKLKSAEKLGGLVALPKQERMAIRKRMGGLGRKLTEGQKKAFVARMALARGKRALAGIHRRVKAVRKAKGFKKGMTVRAPRKGKKVVWTKERRAAFAAMMAAARRRKHGFKHVAYKKISKKALAILVKKGASKMAKSKRKSHKKHGKHKNPFSIQGIMAGGKGLLSTGLLIDSALVATGFVASKFGIDYAASKFPMLATPYGKIGSRLGLGFLALYAGKMAGKQQYAEPLFIGFAAPAILDLVEVLVPNLIPSGVKMLAGGYMPDVQSTVSLEQGYMPDVQSVAGMGNYMPDVAQSEVGQ